MAEDFVSDEDSVFITITPRKFRKWDLLAVGLQTVSRTFSAVADGFTDVAGVLLRHSEYEQMQNTFHQEAAYELETLINEVENGTAN